MAKKKQKLNVAALCGVVAAVLGIVAILMELLTGYSISGSFLGETSVTNYSVFDLIFGCDATATINDNGEIVNHVNVGLLIAFILLIIGVLGSCCGAFLSLKDAKKGALVACIASLCLIVAGILFLCTKSLTGLETGDTSKEGGIGGLIGQSGSGVKTSIGAGVYLTGIIGIVAGVADCPVVLAGFKK